MDFQDFPMILGNLGVETDHPPKMCARLASLKHSAVNHHHAHLAYHREIPAHVQEALLRLRGGHVLVLLVVRVHFNRKVAAIRLVQTSARGLQVRCR